MSESAPGEFAIIERWFSRPAGRADVVLGVGDDAAVLTVPPGFRLVAAVDTVVSGIHFLPDAEPADIGHRALAVNLSDLAAMGAQPAWALLSLSLPEPSVAWLDGFARGFHELAARFGVALVGGDTVRGPLVVTVAIMGHIEVDRFLARSGAHPGDHLYVSGVPGEAAAGLDLLRQGSVDSPQARYLKARFLRPEPRVALGRLLRPHASAAMDVSDGLIGDLAKLCAASGCGAEVELAQLPVSPAMSALFPAAAGERCALQGGDDYELLFTLPPAAAGELARNPDFARQCTRIGTITRHDADRPVVQCLRNGRAEDVAAGGFDHFAKG